MKPTKASQENIDRAKEYILKAITSKQPDILAKIIDGGFPVDEPLMDHSR
mgnify:CR=1 FL=1